MPVYVYWKLQFKDLLMSHHFLFTSDCRLRKDIYYFQGCYILPIFINTIIIIVSINIPFIMRWLFTIELLKPFVYFFYKITQF